MTACWRAFGIFVFVVSELVYFAAFKRVEIASETQKPPRGGFFLFAPTYFSKANTLCCDWLAWANIAVAACEMICALARLVDSLA